MRDHLYPFLNLHSWKDISWICLTHRHWYCVGHLTGQPCDCSQKISPHSQVARRWTFCVVPSPSDRHRLQSSQSSQLCPEAAGRVLLPQVSCCRQTVPFLLWRAKGLGEEIDKFDQQTGCAAAAAGFLLLLLPHLTPDRSFCHGIAARVADLVSECVAGNRLHRRKPWGKAVVGATATAAGTGGQWKEVEKEQDYRSWQMLRLSLELSIAQTLSCYCVCVHAKRWKNTKQYISTTVDILSQWVFWFWQK